MGYYHTYSYEVDDGCECYEFESNGTVDWETGKAWVAEEAAKDFFYNHDGWEMKWPIDFTLYDGEELLGKYEVDMEQVPQFCANVVED
jgi:hypothetical protein